MPFLGIAAKVALSIVARCDDCLGSAVPPLEVNLIIVFPKRGKCVGPAGFCVNEGIRRGYTYSALVSALPTTRAAQGATPLRNSEETPTSQPGHRRRTS